MTAAPPRSDRPERLWLRSFAPFLGALALLVLVGSPAEAARRSWPQASILAAIRAVESGDRDDAPDGDGGAAIGPYQIHREYWLDAVAADPGLGGRYEDCRDRDYATRVVIAYMQRHAPGPWSRGEAETIARIHNGGPRGARLAATIGYWERVRRRLPP